MIEEIVFEHRSGKLAYHVALDKMVELGMEQLEAHELLFPPLGDDDFQLQIPTDPNDIMQLQIIDIEGEEE